jgi:hypothetical protein
LTQAYIDGILAFYAGLLLSVMSIAALVTIVIMMVVPPLPVAFLVFSRQVAILAMRLNAAFDHPLVVIDSFIPVPAMVIVVIVVVITVGATSGRHDQQNQGA